MKKILSAVILLIALAVLPAGPVLADTGSAYPWNNHAAPFTFLFGNHIDSHQQSQALTGGQLQGFLYIHYTGETINGIPVAEHTDCSADPSACVVGWVFQGVPAQATVVGMDEMGMAQFCVNAATSRQLIGFSHFHWLGDPADDMGLQMGQSYTGYLLKLTARTTFYFRHHDMQFLVTPGIDTTTHANVTACP